MPDRQPVLGRASRRGWLATWAAALGLWGQFVFSNTRLAPVPAPLPLPAQSPRRQQRTVARPIHNSARRHADTLSKLLWPAAAPRRRPADGRWLVPDRGEYPTLSRVQPRGRKAYYTRWCASARGGLRRNVPA